LIRARAIQSEGVTNARVICSQDQTGCIDKGKYDDRPDRVLGDPVADITELKLEGA
jgi:hypothetical protein